MCCNKKCFCERTFILTKNILGIIKNNILLCISFLFTLIFAVFGTILLYKGINETGERFFTGAAFAAAALTYNACCYQLGSREKSSEFYLDKIRQYFNQAISLIQNSGNNNIKWHQAIICLKTTVELFPRLIESSHKEIYITDYINTAYSIIDRIQAIDSFKFFYGINPYENKDAKELYQESMPIKLGASCPRIDPQWLLLLFWFMYKASCISHARENNGATLKECCLHITSLTKNPIPRLGAAREFASSLSSLIEYIEDFEANQKVLEDYQNNTTKQKP